jgi:hypothetical protein
LNICSNRPSEALFDHFTRQLSPAQKYQKYRPDPVDNLLDYVSFRLLTSYGARDRGNVWFPCTLTAEMIKMSRIG